VWKWEGKKLADAKPDGGEAGAYSRKVGSGDNVTEAAGRNENMRGTVLWRGGVRTGGQADGTDGGKNGKKRDGRAGQVIWMAVLGRHRMGVDCEQKRMSNFFGARE
jgi:hypothetical protein